MSSAWRRERSRHLKIEGRGAMRTSEAARYARWSAGVALLLAAVSLSVYLHRAWIARQERKKAPAPTPPTVETQSRTVTFSKAEGERTLFTVRASRSTEFRNSEKSVLEDVEITIFGQDGSRNDTLHTQICDYTKSKERISCAGDVQMELQSAADAARARAGQGAEHVVRVKTRAVAFDRQSGEAQTDQPVEFSFPQGAGKAVGVRYRSEDGLVQLDRGVELTLRRDADGVRGAESLKATGSRLEYRRDTRQMRLRGLVRATLGAHELTAGDVGLALDGNYHAQWLTARTGSAGGPRPAIHSQQRRGAADFSADELVALFHPQGWIAKVEGTGNVQATLREGGNEEHIRAERADLELSGKLEEPQEVTAIGNVFAESKPSRAGGTARSLRTGRLRLRFTHATGKKRTRLETAETLAPGTLEWSGGNASGIAQQHTELSAEQIITRFDDEGRAETLEARGQVSVDRRIAGRPQQTTKSKELEAKIGKDGDWSQMVLRGDVRLREGERSGQADRAEFARADQTAALKGNAAVSDGTTRTTAQTISIVQATGEIRADGEVRSSDLAAGKGTVQLASQPAHISADHLLGNSTTGRAVYTGRARLWQGDWVVEADTIELLRATKQLNAKGNVFAVFPQSEGLGGKSAAKAGPPVLWRVRAGTLAYWGGEGRARLEQAVHADSTQGEISAAALDVYFTRGGLAGGAQQLSRAVGTGGVTVRQGTRRGTAERGEYTAAESKFVLSGGNPTLTDAFRGTTTGRQLTFFLADDTILVDSELGQRALTKHRVEK